MSCHQMLMFTFLRLCLLGHNEIFVKMESDVFGSKISFYNHFLKQLCWFNAILICKLFKTILLAKIGQRCVIAEVQMVV
jgi:hypothetical protein